MLTVVDVSTTEDASKSSSASETTTTTSVLSLTNNCAISVMSPNRSKVASIGVREVVEITAELEVAAAQITRSKVGYLNMVQVGDVTHSLLKDRDCTLQHLNDIVESSKSKVCGMNPKSYLRLYDSSDCSLSSNRSGLFRAEGPTGFGEDLGLVVLYEILLGIVVFGFVLAM